MPISRNRSATRSLKTRSAKPKSFHRYSKKAADKASQTNSLIARIALNDKNMAAQRKCFSHSKTLVSKNIDGESCDQLPNSPLREVILNEDCDDNCVYIQAGQNVIPKCNEDDHEFFDNLLCGIKSNSCNESITEKSTASPKRNVDQRHIDTTQLEITSNVECNNGDICSLFNVHNNVEILCNTPVQNVEQVQTLLTATNTLLLATCEQSKNNGTEKAHVTSKCQNDPSSMSTLNRNYINTRRSPRHTSAHQPTQTESPSKSKSAIVNDCAHCDLLTECYVDDRPSSSAIHQCDDDWSSDVECQNGSTRRNISQVCQQMELDQWMLEQNGFTDCKVCQKLSREARSLWKNVDKIVLAEKFKRRKELLGNCITLPHL
ncbi:hypothetical protein DdX_09090 [Ditylenchus destructor]|uniref:Uncharacterized protein n=1 Tax=Ditylenchus destructor TaxID=166010 RepID=A0AAD4N5K5_9BILA|nr:hypothetical protein DdX_09090 [Ditylenchus destructor]